MPSASLPLVGLSVFFLRVGEHGCSGEISCVKHVCCACFMILVFLISRLASRQSVCSQLHELIYLKPRGTDIVAVQRSVILLHSSGVRESSRVIHHRHPSLLYLKIIDTIYIRYDISFKSGSGARVTVYGMSGTEGQDPGGTDPIDLQLP